MEKKELIIETVKLVERTLLEKISVLEKRLEALEKEINDIKSESPRERPIMLFGDSDSEREA